MKLGNVYQLKDGRTATIDFWDVFHFGITCSDGEQKGFGYIMSVERWLFEKHNAKLIKEGEGGYSDSRLCKYCSGK